MRSSETSKGGDSPSARSSTASSSGGSNTKQRKKKVHISSLDIEPRPLSSSGHDDSMREVIVEPIFLSGMSREGKKVGDAGPPLYFSSLGLYCREDQTKELRKRWETSKTSRQLVLISGAAGSGKSSLVQHFQTHVLANKKNDEDYGTSTTTVPSCIADDGGAEVDAPSSGGGPPRGVLRKPEAPSFFAIGKFDQQQRDEPYAGIATACNELCHGILGEFQFAARKTNTDQFQMMQAKLLEAVGSYSDVLTTVVPKLQLLLDYEKEDDASSSTILRLSSLPAGTSARVGSGGATTKTTSGGDDRSSSRLRPSPSNQVGYLDSKYLFTRAFLSFIRFVVGCFGSLVLALDDLQWADHSSLDLIKAIMSDTKNPSILVIGIYRNEGNKESNSLSNFVRDIESFSEIDAGRTFGDASSSSSSEASKLSYCQIEVGNLDVQHICQLLEDLLKMGKSKVESLAQCIHRKTLGNSFFVKQFIGLLHAQGLLVYTSSSRSGPRGQEEDQSGWCWDVDAINIKTSATANVGDLMASKLKSMSLGVRSLIPLVASLGSVFSRSFLQLVFERFAILVDVDEDSEGIFGPEDFLKECEEDGLICSLVGDLYCWEHDKIQEAALLLVERSRRNPLQFELGNVLLTRLTATELDQHIFIVANLIGDSVWLSVDDPRRIEAAQVLLRAGKKAAKISSFELASHYLRRGIDLLPLESWEEHRRIKLELFSSAAEAELCLGHFDKMHEFCDEILAGDLPLLDTRRAYTALLGSYRAQGKFGIARLLCTEVLANLDFHIPRRGSARAKLETISSIVRLKLTSTKRFMKRLEGAGAIEDEKMKWREELMDDLSFAVAQDCPDMAPLILMKGVQSMMANGASDYSAITLYTVGYLHAMFADYKTAKVYAEKALSLLSSLDYGSSRKIESRCLLVIHLFLLPWQLDLEVCREGLFRGYQAGINFGDTENAGWCIYSHLENAFHSGVTNIGTIANECRIYSTQMKELKQDKISGFIWLIWKIVQNLGDDGKEEPKLLQNSSVEDERCMVFYSDFQQDAHFQINRKRLDLHESFWLGEFERFLDIVDTVGFDRGVYEKAYHSVSPGIPTMHFHLSLVGFICSKDPNLRKKMRKISQSLRHKFRRQIKVYVKKGNPNVVHYDLLLDAETAALKKGNKMVATRYFEEAILQAREGGFRHDEALFYERFAQYLMGFSSSPEDEQDAKAMMEHAIQLYEKHGMQARAKSLALTYAAKLVPSNPSP
jgi:predicted ATPase